MRLALSDTLELRKGTSNPKASWIEEDHKSADRLHSSRYLRYERKNINNIDNIRHLQAWEFCQFLADPHS